ncbi:hypothetical protein TrVE_jg10284 [Triparma verrucosa]|uniref:Galactose oxidase n=1 Tax=Triparma verrucosa TaxID=1606542 RepID=A0A9W7BZ66_9STRA|nr:hypothetical protein TrVE_jg10284 [Triparma verrucosa]
MPSITLTIDNVSFSLKQSTISSSINFDPLPNGGYSVRLKDFTGVLEVATVLDSIEDVKDEPPHHAASKVNTPAKLSALPIVSAVKANPNPNPDVDLDLPPSPPLPIAQSTEVDSPRAAYLPPTAPTAPTTLRKKKRKISYSSSSVIVKSAAQRKEEKETTPVTSNTSSSKKSKSKKAKKEKEKNQPTMSQFCVKEEPSGPRSQAGPFSSAFNLSSSATQEAFTGTNTSDATVRADDHEQPSLSMNYHGTDPFSPGPGPAPPTPRWGHTTTMIDNNRIIVYGGQCVEEDGEVIMSDLTIYDLEKREWEDPLNCDGIPRQWHTSTYIPERQLLVAFGGETTTTTAGKSKSEITDEVMVLDVDMMLWYPPKVSGDVPSGRSGHSATMLPSRELVIFGGNKNGRWHSSFACLDTFSWSWTQPSAQGNAPKPRAYHTATAVGNKIVIFGGNDKQGVLDSLCILERIEGEGDKGWRWSNPNVLGTGPAGRTGHSAVALDDDNILIHGGWDPYVEGDEEVMFKDSFILDVNKWTWRAGPTMKYLGDVGGGRNGGPRRAGAEAVLVPGGEVWTFGGRLEGDRFGDDWQLLNAAPYVISSAGPRSAPTVNGSIM